MNYTKNSILESAKEKVEGGRLNWKLMCRPNALIACYSNKKHDINWRKKPTRQFIWPGRLSTNARRKLKQSIRWLIACSTTKQVFEKRYNKKVDWKINLATLTFHENLQDDNQGRKLLSQWLEMAKYRFELKQYVWKAEPQERGAIHFHLMTNVYIPHSELNYTWNRLLRKNKLNNIDDNSTDIHAVTEAKNLEAYLTDYMLNDEKHAGRRPIQGRLWGCSHGISQAGKKFLLISKEELQAISEDLQQYSLAAKIKAQGKEPPEFLKFTGYWILPDNYYKQLPDCELKQQWLEEITALKQKQQKELFPLLN